MVFRSKKMAVLYQIGQEICPISLRQLLEKLGGEYVERSVRRWLSEMIQEGLVEKLGNKRGSKYRAVVIKQSELDYPTFGPESKIFIEQLRRPLYERIPITYVDDWIKSYKPNISFYIPEKWRLQLHQKGKRSRQEDPAGTYAHQIYSRLLIDLSYNSSRLEGNTYSLLETQKLLLEGSAAEGKLDEEKIMILNHKEAIRYLIDQAPRLEISRETICTLHYLLADGLVEAQYSGKVRDHGVRIGGSTYIPFEDPKQLLIRLDLIAQKAAKIEDPYEQSFFLLVHISYLQAFSDVNKRTARLSSNISLIKNNFVPLSFNDVDKEDYILAIIAIYELQNVGPLLDLYLFSYLRTCTAYDVTVKAMGFDEIRVRYRSQRRALLQRIIVNELKGKELNLYVSLEAEKIIPKEDLESFMGDVFEDLRDMDESRIAGLGVTVEQLHLWLSLQSSHLRNL